ncbi:MAG: hypothetical protein QGG40_20780, partial [Myxococcota bacterium]|nr:hypothetical protein [Myxococcota bacterium]
MTIAYAVAALFVSFVLLGLGNTVGYHRLLTHRAFRARPGARVVLTLLGAMHSGPPCAWVGLHRYHHMNSDREDDPHTPTRGFWWGHCGWLMGTGNPLLCLLFALSGFGQQARLLVHDLMRVVGRNPPTWRQLCPDLWKEPVMRWLDVPGVMPLQFAAQVAVAWNIGSWWGVAWLWALHLVLTNGSWAVNSVCHWSSFGEQRFDTGEGSR